MGNIENTFNECMNKINQMNHEFYWHDRNCYAQWLRDTYEYVENSTRILAHAAAVMPKKYSPFSDRFITHAAEEKGHEKLLLNDLKGLGINVNELSASNSMKFFHQSLYYWLSHQGNVMGLFGWIFTLEGAAVVSGDSAYRKVKECYGAKASSFLKVHSAEDPNHLKQAFAIIDSLGDSDRNLVQSAMKQYSQQYVTILKEINHAHSNTLRLVA